MKEKTYKIVQFQITRWIFMYQNVSKYKMDFVSLNPPTQYDENASAFNNWLFTFTMNFYPPFAALGQV